MELNAYQKLILKKILKEHKEFTKDLPECFRDDEVVDELLEKIDKGVKSC